MGRFFFAEDRLPWNWRGCARRRMRCVNGWAGIEKAAPLGYDGPREIPSFFRILTLNSQILRIPSRQAAIDPNSREPSMNMSSKVQKILSNYESDNPGTKAN